MFPCFCVSLVCASLCACTCSRVCVSCSSTACESLEFTVEALIREESVEASAQRRSSVEDKGEEEEEMEEVEEEEEEEEEVESPGTALQTLRSEVGLGVIYLKLHLNQWLLTSDVGSTTK